MKFETVVKGGTVVNAGGSVVADVGIDGETITALGRHLEGAEVVDATGRYVFPGGIDAHVHFQLPFGGTVSADDFENGTKAAACGGVTTIIDFAMQTRGDSLEKAVADRRAEADGKVSVDYGLHGAITDWNENTAREMRRLAENGVPTFKMFMIYRNEGWISSDADLFQALEIAGETGAQIGVHAESAEILDFLIARTARDPDVTSLGAVAHAKSRPPVVEWEAVQRALAWAEATGGRLYVVHTSTARAAALIARARDRGVNALCETCPQYLLLDESVFEREDGHLFATCPQIKTKEDAAALWRGLASGGVHVLATDTCTFTTEQKALWKGDFRKIPFGVPGVETFLPLTYAAGPAAGRLTLERWVALVSENPARIFGLYPQKGVVQPGADADIVVWNPDRGGEIRAADLQTNCDWNPFEGFALAGKPERTFCRGKEVARDGRFTGKPGYGRFVERKTGGGL